MQQNNLLNNTGICKTKRELLREKVDNLATYCIMLKPEYAPSILKFKQLSEEEIIIWIASNILPRKNELNKLVEDWMKLYKIEIKDEIKNKFIRYCQFFIKILDK